MSEIKPKLEQLKEMAERSYPGERIWFTRIIEDPDHPENYMACMPSRIGKIFAQYDQLFLNVFDVPTILKMIQALEDAHVVIRTLKPQHKKLNKITIECASRFEKSFDEVVKSQRSEYV